MLDLGKLRRTAGLTQTAVADLMMTTQTAVSRLERQEDWKVSTLTAYLNALGVEAELVVRLGDQTITQTLTKPGRKAR